MEAAIKVSFVEKSHILLEDNLCFLLKTSAERHHHLEEVHQEWMRKLLVEQRTRYCHFIEKFSPVVVRKASNYFYEYL